MFIVILEVFNDINLTSELIWSSRCMKYYKDFLLMEPVFDIKYPSKEVRDKINSCCPRRNFTFIIVTL